MYTFSKMADIFKFIISLTVLSQFVSFVNSTECIGKYNRHPSSSSFEIHQRNLSIPDIRRFDQMPAKTTFENNGHTIVVKFTYSHEIKVTILMASLGDTNYELEFMQYNWLSESESDELPAEIHMIFRNQKYNSYKEALGTDLGLLILSYRHKVQELPFSDMNPFYEALDNIVHPHTKTDVFYPNIPPLYHIGMFIFSDYYMYVGKYIDQGGNCQADVIWLEFPNAILINMSQVEYFRNLRTFDGTPLMSKAISYLSPNSSIYQAVDLLRYEKKGRLAVRFEGFRSTADVTSKNVYLILFLIIGLCV